MRPQDMIWTEEKVSILKDLWLKGHSGSDIARAMGQGLTRSAVIGKAHRLKLTAENHCHPKNPHNHYSPRRSRENRYAREKRELVIGNSNNINPEATPVSILELKASTCRWMVNSRDALDGLYCGAATETTKSSYCDTHAKTAHRMSATRKPGSQTTPKLVCMPP